MCAPSSPSLLSSPRDLRAGAKRPQGRGCKPAPRATPLVCVWMARVGVGRGLCIDTERARPLYRTGAASVQTQSAPSLWPPSRWAQAGLTTKGFDHHDGCQSPVSRVIMTRSDPVSSHRTPVWRHRDPVASHRGPETRGGLPVAAWPAASLTRPRTRTDHRTLQVARRPSNRSPPAPGKRRSLKARGPASPGGGAPPAHRGRRADVGGPISPAGPL